MSLYLIIFGVVAISALTSVAFNERREIVAAKATLICAMFWVLSFARWKNGTDWDSYIYVYRTLEMHGTLHDAFSGYMAMEPGYLLLNLMLGFLNSYHAFLMCIGFIIVALKLYRIIDLSTCATISCLVYLCTMLGDIFFVRQSIAISICFFAYKYLIEKKPGKYIACVLLATTFHYSAMVALLGLFAAKQKPRSSTRDLIVLILAAAASAVAMNFLFKYAASYFSAIPYLAAREIYIENNKSVGALSSTSRNLARIANILIVYMFFTQRASYIKDAAKATYTVMLNLFFGASLIVCFFSMVSVEAVRFSMYFTTAGLILFPMAIFTYKGSKRLIALAIVAAYLFLQYIVFMQPYYHYYVPYHFWGVNF